MILFQKSRQVVQPFLTFVRGLDPPCCPHQVQGVALLFFGQFVEVIAHLMIAAAWYGLITAEHFFDSTPQRLGAVDDEQVPAVGRRP